MYIVQFDNKSYSRICHTAYSDSRWRRVIWTVDSENKVNCAD